jgi:hypothetical protein
MWAIIYGFAGVLLLGISGCIILAVLGAVFGVCGEVFAIGATLPGERKASWPPEPTLKRQVVVAGIIWVLLGWALTPKLLPEAVPVAVALGVSGALAAAGLLAVGIGVLISRKTHWNWAVGLFLGAVVSGALAGAVALMTINATARNLVVGIAAGMGLGIVAGFLSVLISNPGKRQA